MSVKIVLTHSEYDAAHALGVKRETARVRDGLSEKDAVGWGLKKQATQNSHNGDGAVAEYALAKFLETRCSCLGIISDWCKNKAYQDDPEKIKRIACDVGLNLQVRCTRTKHGSLCLHARDKDDAPYILAVLDGLTVVFIGWLFGREGKTDKAWERTSSWPSPCFASPQSILRPMGSLHPADTWEGYTPCTSESA